MGKNKGKSKEDEATEVDEKPKSVATVDDEDGEDRQPMQVELGDFVKVKQVLDETVVKGVMSMDYGENHYWDNVKLGLMIVACAFAVVAQFYPMPFPQSRPLLGVCCAAYFIASSILQFIVTYIEKDCIMITEPKAGITAEDAGLRIRTTFPRFAYDFTLVIQEDSKEGEKKTCTKEFKIYDYFTQDGWFDEDSFQNDVCKVMERYEAKNFDKDKKKPE